MDEEIKQEDVVEASPEASKPDSKFVVIGIIVVVVILAGGFYLSMRSANSNSELTTTAQATATASPAALASETKEFMIDGGGFYFKPAEIKVKKGDTVKITFVDKGGSHDLTIDGYVKIGPIKEGSASGEFVADKAGIFEYYCSVDGHKEKGMVGKLTVE